MQEGFIMSDQNKFVYHYSSKQQEQVKQIRDKYIPKEESKLDLLKKIDASVTNKATASAIAFGVISSLIFGGGMYLILDYDVLFFQGIITGVIGILVISLTYPLYKCVLRKEREKHQDQILKLSDEIMGEN